MAMRSTPDWSPESDPNEGRSDDAALKAQDPSINIHNPQQTVQSSDRDGFQNDAQKGAQNAQPDSDAEDDSDGPMRFYNRFEDYMEIAAAPETFANYLDGHQEWFHRCAHPMQVNPIDQNSYAITIGHFGAFDYYVEPKVGLELLPPEQGVYGIRTVPVPDDDPPGYAVDFQAAMKLVAVDNPDEAAEQPVNTHVTWTLDLNVDVWFPRFIRVLPQGLIQRTGDRLLGQIVRQVSRRLTAKVQTDFHESQNLPFPQQLQRNRSFF